MKSLDIKEKLEDILVTIETQYHILRPIVNEKGLFIYVVLNKAKSNLALARRQVLKVEEDLSL